MKFPVALLLLLLLFQQNSAQISRRSNNNPRNSEFIIVSEDSSRISKSMFPLAKGNTYQYFCFSIVPFWNSREYTLKTVKIVRDTIFNNKSYYSFEDNGYSFENLVDLKENIYYRYDTSSNKLFMNYDEVEGLYYDFGLPPNTEFQGWKPVYPFDENIKVLSDNYSFFGINKKRVKEVRTWGKEKHTNTYAEGIGIVKRECIRVFLPASEYYYILVNALIYDENGKCTYFTEGFKPRLSVIPFNALRRDIQVLSFDCTVEHIYDYASTIENERIDGIVYIDTVSMNYFYLKGKDSTSFRTIYASRVNIEGKYVFRIPINTSLIKNGYDFMYRITAKDKALIPQYTSWPENGYYKAIGDPFLEVNDNLNKADYFSLEQNYRNPFNPSTTIRYSIAVKGPVKMSVYNSLGQEVKILVNEQKDPGQYYAVFNADQLSSGIYFCRLSSGNSVLTRKMVLLK